MLVEREEELLPVDGPHFNGLVIRGCDQSLSITRKVYTAHGGSVSPEYCWLSFPVSTHKHQDKFKKKKSKPVGVQKCVHFLF